MTVKPFAILPLVLLVLLPALPARATDATERYERYRDAPAGSPEKERLYREYIAAAKGAPARDAYSGGATADGGEATVTDSEREADLDRLSTAEIYDRYQREKDPTRKADLYRAYAARVKRGETGAKSGPAAPSTPSRDAYGKIPTPQYLADTPTTLPAAVQKKRKKGLGGLFRSLEDTSEKSLGALVTTGLELMNGVSKDPALTTRLRRVSDLIERVQERPIDVKYKLLNMNVVNAFACPGGTVYVTPAMMNFVSSDSELAFVLAHETGHVVARHSVKQMEQGMALDYLIKKSNWKVLQKNQDAARVASAFLALSYSRKDEFEADDYGYRYMTAAGYNPYAAVTFMNKMKQQFESKKNPKVMTWLQTHPSLHDRYDRAVGFYNAFAASHPQWKQVNGR